MMKMMTKCVLLAVLLPFPSYAQRQDAGIKRIYFNLYTDSIKTVLNYYVNVEGEYRNGRVLPMDTGLITIVADHGRMAGNDWIAPRIINFDKVTFHAAVKAQPFITDDITVWLKRARDPRDEMDLPTVPESMKKRH